MEQGGGNEVLVTETMIVASPVVLPQSIIERDAASDMPALIVT